MPSDKEMADRPARVVEEIEITPEMIEAGVAELSKFSDRLTFGDLGRGDQEWLVDRVVRKAISARRAGSVASASATQ